MSSLKPTLFNKGSLISNDNNPANQEKLNQEIPIEFILNWIKRRNLITNPKIKDRVLILKSSTGSGKSVALPPILFKEFYQKKQGSIAVTQPRVLTTISIVKDQIAKSGYYPWMKLEDNLGWQTSSNKKMISEGLIYMTLGIFIMQIKILSPEEIMKKYRFIIIDEVHESTIDLAAGLFMLKQLFVKNECNKNLPFLILMSATFNAGKFLNYFGLEMHCENFIQIAGHTFEKTLHWPGLKNSSSLSIISSAELEKMIFYPGRKYTESAALLANKIHEIAANDDINLADILIFLPGEKEIKEVKKYLSNSKDVTQNRPQETKYILLTITSDSVAKKSMDFINLSLPLNQIILDENSERSAADLGIKRRIILSTVVAETGLTINTLKYVIDCGYIRTIEYNPFIGTSGLITKPAAQSRLIQRMGRIGRVAAGHYFPLFHKDSFDLFQKEQFSEAEVNDVSELLLLAANSENFSIQDKTLDMPDNIPLDILFSSLHKLHLLGFLNPNYQQNEVPASAAAQRWEITGMGRAALKFPHIPMEYLRMIFGAYAWHLSVLDAITITAYLITEGRFQASNKIPIRWRNIYLLGLPKFFLQSAKNLNSTQKDKTKFIIVERVRLVLSDNFLDGIWVFNAIQEITKASNQKNPSNININSIADIEKFCESAGLSADTIFEFLRLRDEIIEAVLAAGFNPFIGQNLVKIEEANFIPTVTKWKYLFYESMRQNLAYYDSSSGQYQSIKGFRFDPPEALKIEYTFQPDGTPEISFKRRPNLLIYEPAAKVTIRPDPNKSGEYYFKIDRISVLDGYVEIDDFFYS
jgi:HrpA-like RNA helicase